MCKCISMCKCVWVCVGKRERERGPDKINLSSQQTAKVDISFFPKRKRKKFEKCLSKTFKLLSPQEQGTGTGERERETD